MAFWACLEVTFLEVTLDPQGTLNGGTFTYFPCDGLPSMVNNVVHAPAMASIGYFGTSSFLDVNYKCTLNKATFKKCQSKN